MVDAPLKEGGCGWVGPRTAFLGSISEAEAPIVTIKMTHEQ